MALETAYGLDPGLALSLLFRKVFAGGGMDATLGHRDAVKGAVELAIAAAIEAVPDAAPRGSRDRRHTGLSGKLGV